CGHERRTVTCGRWSARADERRLVPMKFAPSNIPIRAMSIGARASMHELVRAALLLLLLANVPVFCARAAEFPRFPDGAIWNQDVSGVLPDTDSAKMITASVGWGTGTTSFQIDFSMHVVYTAGQTATLTPLVKESGYYTPDCDTGLSVPLPPVGAI